MTKVYPGMLCQNSEIFVSGSQVNVISNGTVKPFAEISFPHYQLLKETAQSDEKIMRELERMCPGSEFHQIEKFAMCRFGGIDFHPDIQDNRLTDGDHWDCPLKGSCSGEGVVCKSVRYNGQALSRVKIDLIKLLATDKTNQTIALELDIPEGTMHLLKKDLYKIFTVQTKQELALKAHYINLI